MTDTKRYERPDAAKKTGEPQEIQTRISCKGRRVSDVLDEMARALSDAEVQHKDPLIVLEDLAQLADSVTGLIKGVSRLLANYPRKVTFWEASGLTEAFLSVMDGPSA